MQYSQKVMEHFTNPHNVGKIEDADGVGEIGNAKCGDIMKMYLKIENDIIVDVKFNTYGCASAIATISSPMRNSHSAPTFRNMRPSRKINGMRNSPAAGASGVWVVAGSSVAATCSSALPASITIRDGISPSSPASCTQPRASVV